MDVWLEGKFRQRRGQQASTTSERALEQAVKRARAEARDIPYHGAAELHVLVRDVITSTSSGAQVPMSVSIMEGMVRSRGLSEAMSKRLRSQIRKGAPLHKEWTQAFVDLRFRQTNGRKIRASIDEDSSVSGRTRSGRVLGTESASSSEAAITSGSLGALLAAIR